MRWQKARFKGKVVWIAVSEAGVPAAEGGRVAMRYAAQAGSKIYRAAVNNLKLDSAHSPVDLDSGVPADATKKGGKTKRGSGFGKAGTRSAAQAAAAKQDARKKLASLGPEVAIAYTDGGCKGNPGPAGSGVYLSLPDGRTAEASLSLGAGTNNIAELNAIGVALDLLDEVEWPKDARVVVFSDSDYSNGMLVRGWKAKKNTALILGLRERLKARPGVEIVWVAGHAGIDGNERADALATQGVRGISSTVWHTTEA